MLASVRRSPPFAYLAGREAAFDAAFSLLATLIVFGPLIVLGSSDEESYSMAVLSTETFWRQLFSLSDPFWLGNYGTGTLGPSGNWLISNPLTAFAYWCGPQYIYRLTWIMGGSCAAFFCMAVLRDWGVARSVRAVAGVTVLLSAPALCYSYFNDWPDAFFGWTMSFAVLWGLLRLYEAETSRDVLLSTILLGLAAGFKAANSTPGGGFVVVYVLVILTCVLIVQRPRKLPYYAAAALLAAIIAAPMIYAAVSSLFDEASSIPYRSKANLPVGSIFYLGLRPLSSLLFGGRSGVLEDPYAYRAVYFGGVFFAAACVAAVSIAIRTFRANGGGLRDGGKRALAVGFVAALGLVFAPHSLGLNLVNDMWLFRDPLTIVGVVLGALALASIRSPALRNALLVLQLLQMAATAAPAWLKPLRHYDQATVFDYRADGPFFSFLRQAQIPKDARISMAGDLAADARSGFTDLGLVATSDFLRQGYAIVNNVWWKGLVVPNLIERDVGSGLGQSVRWSSQKLNAPATRDLFGIQYVIGYTDEAGTKYPAAGLEPVASTVLPRRKREITVFRNRTAWPRAMVLSGSILHDYAALDPSRRCGLVCDPVDWNGYRVSTPDVTMVGTDAMRIRLTGQPPSGSILVVTQTFHGGWRMHVDGRAAQPQPFLGAFGYIPLDVNSAEVVVQFGARTRGVLTLLSFLALALALIAALLLRRKPS